MARRSFALLLTAALGAGVSPARAAWTGDPTQPVEKGAVLIGYQSGSLDVKPVNGGTQTLTLKDRGMVLEQRTAVNPVIQLAFRVLPFTGRINLENSTFNPHMAGGGVGVYAAPPEALGPVHLGVAAIWDGAGGATQRSGTGSKKYDRVFWSETTLSAGASVSVLDFLSLYAGASFVSLRTQFDVAGSGKTKWKENSPWGGFGGVSLTSNQAWFVNAEVRAGGERSLSASLGYKY